MYYAPPDDISGGRLGFRKTKAYCGISRASSRWVNEGHHRHPLPRTPHPTPRKLASNSSGCSALGANKACLVGRNPACSVPAVEGCEGLWSYDDGRT